MGIPEMVKADGPDLGKGIPVNDSAPLAVNAAILFATEAVLRATGFSGILKDMNCFTLDLVTHCEA